ncbi:MAG: nucleoside deaminase [Bacteroidota bacterium]|nr:nucleoside deaminase [Bacteroidota bacterium]MCA6444280.1 nucleoside deaminase [Bacteroidota bacterium]
MEQESHERYMREALKEAEKALALDEVPIGAVIVANNKIIARAHNLTKQLNDVTAHAEMQAITSAANYIGGKYLIDCTMYVTVEPCYMCAGALNWSQISTLVIGTSDSKKGFSQLDANLLHPKTKTITGILKEDCKALIQGFFEKKRK